MTLAAGTCTSCSNNSPVSMPRTPILRSVDPTETPSVDRSTMKAEMESCLRDVTSSAVLANTVYQSACTTPDIQHLVPLRIQPPGDDGSGTALVRIPMTSDPACGSDKPNAARSDPSAIPGR